MQEGAIGTGCLAHVGGEYRPSAGAEEFAAQEGVGAQEAEGAQEGDQVKLSQSSPPEPDELPWLYMLSDQRRPSKPITRKSWIRGQKRMAASVSQA